MKHDSQGSHTQSGESERTTASAVAEIELLRDLRAFRSRDVTITSLIEKHRAHADQTQRKLGDLIALWQELAPDAIVAGTTLTGLRAGVLSVDADSASIKYELEQSLHDGLLATLRARYRGTLTRVRARIVPSDEHQRT